jgi:uncharacterized repeat protein (TIGR01451 family)
MPRRAPCGPGALALVLALGLTLVAPGTARANDVVPLGPGSDLSLAMTASAGFANGGNATYTITATNNGAFATSGTITLVDTLPAGLTYTSATGTAWTCSAAGQIVTCTNTTSYPNKAVLPAVTLVAAITNSVAFSVTNSADIATSANNDPNLTNNRATVTSAVSVKRVATTPNGATVSQLPSNGTSYSQTFVVIDSGNVSDSYSLVASVAPAGVVGIVSVNGVNGTTGTTATLAAGVSTNVVVVYTVSSAAATGASAMLMLRATSTTNLTVQDTADVTVTVARAGITMTKALYRDNQTTLVTGPAGVQPGEFVQYKVTVTSSGGAPANSVSVSDVLPAAVTYTSSAGDAAGWTISNAAGTVTANLSGALAAGAARYFWIRVRVK